MGRPPTRAVTLRDGFYIQVRSKGSSSVVKIRSIDNEGMMENARLYEKDKEVIILGELKKGVWVNEQKEDAIARAKKKKAKAELKVKTEAKARAAIKSKLKVKAA